MTEGRDEGDRVVVLDGNIIPADHQGPLEFEGWYARHSLPWVPQVRALTDVTVEEQILCNSGYWYERKIDED